MKKSIIINSKEYEIPELKFSTIRNMEKAGINFLRSEEEPFEFSSQLFMFFSGLDKATADKELDEHFDNGGQFDDLAPLVNSIKDFFTQTKKHQK